MEHIKTSREFTLPMWVAFPMFLLQGPIVIAGGLGTLWAIWSFPTTAMQYGGGASLLSAFVFAFATQEANPNELQRKRLFVVCATIFAAGLLVLGLGFLAYKIGF